jgi:hypothetical protein
MTQIISVVVERPEGVAWLAQVLSHVFVVAVFVLAIRLLIASFVFMLNAIGRALGTGDCLRCHRNWMWVQHHTTDYGGGGCFPLCERCWRQLKTAEARWPFYMRLFGEWDAQTGPTDRERLATTQRLREAMLGHLQREQAEWDHRAWDRYYFGHRLRVSRHAFQRRTDDAWMVEHTVRWQGDVVVLRFEARLPKNNLQDSSQEA